MDMRQHVGAFAQHRLGVVAEVVGVRRAVEELHPLRVDRADDVDRRLQRLAPVLGMRLDVEVDPLLLEDRHQLLHRAPPGVLAGLDHRAGVAAVAGALVGVRAAAELRVHRVDAELDGDLDGALPVLDGGLPLDLVVRGPAVHRQQRGDADAIGLQRLLEAAEPVGEDARGLEPLEEIRARAEFDPLVAELGDLARQLVERQVAVHEGVEGDLHPVLQSRSAGGLTRGADAEARQARWSRPPGRAGRPVVMQLRCIGPGSWRR